MFRPAASELTGLNQYFSWLDACQNRVKKQMLETYMMALLAVLAYILLPSHRAWANMMLLLAVLAWIILNSRRAKWKCIPLDLHDAVVGSLRLNHLTFTQSQVTMYPLNDAVIGSLSLNHFKFKQSQVTMYPVVWHSSGVITETQWINICNCFPQERCDNIETAMQASLWSALSCFLPLILRPFDH